ncbi:MAG: SurA N-terminal domain-containing protein [Nitrospirota bacterium]|jgi:peptidyl-prolyl cis-trans isomerase D
MLKHMRKHAKYFYALFVIVILSFIFWGTGTVDQNSAAVPLAQIGDVTITLEEYWRTYENTASLYRDVYGSEFDAEEMGLKDAVLKNMIDERLLLAAALEAGMTVSDEELEEAIVNDPAFMRGGAFDKEVYRNSLNIYRMTASQYEGLKRRELLLDKMRRLVEETVELTPSDVKGLEGSGEIYKSLRETLLESKKEAALESFLNGVKKKVPVSVNKQLIS